MSSVPKNTITDWNAYIIYTLHFQGGIMFWIILNKLRVWKQWWRPSSLNLIQRCYKNTRHTTKQHQAVLLGSLPGEVASPNACLLRHTSHMRSASPHGSDIYVISIFCFVCRHRFSFNYRRLSILKKWITATIKWKNTIFDVELVGYVVLNNCCSKK